jgi:hypothetical protein
VNLYVIAQASIISNSRSMTNITTDCKLLTSYVGQPINLSLQRIEPRVFVAMPFKEEMDDTYHYGMVSATNAAGFLCERADLSAFTGDVLDWVKQRIRSASLVIADLTEANPNVYLEIGYAWGSGIPTVLVIKHGEPLKFDVRGQRCLVYKKIKDLEDLLTKERQALPKIAQ